jgi:hypothetical protein
MDVTLLQCLLSRYFMFSLVRTSHTSTSSRNASSDDSTGLDVISSGAGVVVGVDGKRLEYKPRGAHKEPDMEDESDGITLVDRSSDGE